MKCLTGSILLLAVNAAIAGDCAEVIALSTTNSVHISNQASVERHASNFCSEYAKGSSVSSNRSFGASYKFLAASFSSGDTSIENVASKYCDSSDGSKANSSAFQDYKQNIAPEAYKAYEACLKYGDRDLTFDFDPNAVVPTQFNATASLQNNGIADATVKVFPSPGVRCAWSKTGTDELTLHAPMTDSVKCERSAADSRSPAFVKFVWTSIADKLPMTVKWPAYDAAGNKIDDLAALQTKLTQANARIQSLEDALKAEASGRKLLVGHTYFVASDFQKDGSGTWDRIASKHVAFNPPLEKAPSSIELGLRGRRSENSNPSMVFEAENIAKDGFTLVAKGWGGGSSTGETWAAWIVVP